MLNNKNKLIGFLAVLSLFVFGLTLSPTSLYAYTTSGGYTIRETGENTVFGGYGYTNTPTSSSAPSVTTKTVQTVNTNTNTTKTKVAVGPSVVTKKVLTTDEVNANSINTNSNLNLSASAGSSKFSFMPNTLLGWLLLFAVIFLAVILWRKIYVTDAEKNKPLKHA